MYIYTHAHTLMTLYSIDAYPAVCPIAHPLARHFFLPRAHEELAYCLTPLTMPGSASETLNGDALHLDGRDRTVPLRLHLGDLLYQVVALCHLQCAAICKRHYRIRYSYIYIYIYTHIYIYIEHNYFAFCEFPVLVVSPYIGFGPIRHARLDSQQKFTHDACV